MMVLFPTFNNVRFGSRLLASYVFLFLGAENLQNLFEMLLLGRFGISPCVTLFDHLFI